jgi:hypothetical protein
MKKVIYVCILVFIVSGCSSESVVLKDNVAFAPNENTPYTGKSAKSSINNDNVKAENSKLTNHLQDEMYLGEIKIIIHNFCSPMLDECEHWVVFKYKNQILKQKVDYLTSSQLSKNEISKKGEFITIDFATGGNCYECSGIYVFKVINQELLFLGIFDNIEGDFLVSSYTDLASNSITGHADVPSWSVYYKLNGYNLVLDANKACDLTHSGRYIEDKNNLLKKINIKNNADNEIYSLILSVLSFYKWCGFENESLDIASKIKESHLSLDYDKVQTLNNIISNIKKMDDSTILQKIKSNRTE